MSLGSNGVDRVFTLPKILMQLHGMITKPDFPVSLPGNNNLQINQAPW